MATAMMMMSMISNHHQTLQEEPSQTHCLQVVLIPVNLFFFAIVAVLFLLFVSDDR